MSDPLPTQQRPPSNLVENLEVLVNDGGGSQLGSSLLTQWNSHSARDCLVQSAREPPKRTATVGTFIGR